MFWLNVAFVISFFFELSSSQPAGEDPIPVTKQFDLVTKQSDGTNIIQLDLLDETTFDFHYDAPSCEDCKCFVDPPVLSLEDLNTDTAALKVIKSYVESNKIYLIHGSDLNDISYSVYDISTRVLKTITRSAKIDSFKGLQDIIFSPSEQAFVGFSKDTLFIDRIDGSGNLQEKAYLHPQVGQVLDIVYAGGLLFLAKGDLGIEIIDPYEDLSGPHIESSTLSIKDLELSEGSEITNLAVDLERRALYAYQSNSENDFLLTLDITNKNEITILNNTKLGFTNIIDFISSNNEIDIIYSHNNNYYYLQLVANSEDKYAQLTESKYWKFPGKVNRLAQNDQKLLVQSDDYVYLFRTSTFHSEHSELFVDIVTKKANGDFFPFISDGLTYLLSIAGEQLTLSSIKRDKTPSLQCGVFRHDFERTQNFVILLLKTDCPEKGTGVPICIYLHQFNLQFSGDTFTDSRIHSPVPIPLFHSPEEEAENTDHSNSQNPTNTNPDEEPTTTEPNEPTPNEPNEPTSNEPNEPTPNEPNEPTPNEPNEPTPNEPNEPSQPTTNEPTTEPGSEPPNKNPNTGPDGGNGTPKPGSSNENDPSVDPNIDIKKPDLIDPDAPYYDKVQNMYALVLVGIIVVTCFGCLIKCLCDFAKNQARIDAQFKHQHLEEEEEGENDSENPSGSSGDQNDIKV